MKMFSQNNNRWKLVPINESKNTIGEVGCLLTSLVNIHNLRNPNDKITPLHLNSALIDNNGYTSGNLIIWAVAEKILKAKIEHIYTGKIEYDLNSYYIANFINFGSGHFTNLISISGENYNIYDVWNNSFYKIGKPRRIVKITYL